MTEIPKDLYANSGSIDALMHFLAKAQQASYNLDTIQDPKERNNQYRLISFELQQTSDFARIILKHLEELPIDIANKIPYWLLLEAEFSSEDK